MKHAFLIIAHNEYPVLEVLLSMLDDERNDIYLHIDKRATELFQQIKKVKMQKAGFYLIENPIKVYWGDISQVQVEYLLFETALSHGPYAYYHLLSGTVKRHCCICGMRSRMALQSWWSASRSAPVQIWWISM